MIPQYLTGVSNPAVCNVARAAGLGLLVTPDTAGKRADYQQHVQHYDQWAADNACFAHGKRFNLTRYFKWLDAFSSEQRARCLFAVAPDVLTQLGDGSMVGDAAATLERSAPVLPEIRARGYRAALVAQDGLDQLDVPWETFDVLFIGGSTQFKLSAAARTLSHEAKRRGKRVHMGRVNSLKRIRIAMDFQCDSVDGTYIKFGPTLNLRRLLGWYQQLRAEQENA